MATVSIPWLLHDPVARAKAERSRRQIAAISELAGAGGSVLKESRQRYGQQTAEDADITRLREMLGGGDATSPPPDTGTGADYAPGQISEEPLAGPTPTPTPSPTITAEGSERSKVYSPPEASPSSDQGVLSRIAEKIAPAWEDPGVADAARGLLGSLAHIGDTGLIMTGLKPDTERQDRLQTRAHLLGRQGREAIHGLRLRNLSHLLGQAQDPGKLIEKVYPEMGVRSGDVAVVSRKSDRHTRWDDILHSVGGDVAAANKLWRASEGGGAGHNPNVLATMIEKHGGDVGAALTEYKQFLIDTHQQKSLRDQLEELETLGKPGGGAAGSDADPTSPAGKGDYLGGPAPTAPGLRAGKGGRFRLDEE